MKLMLLITLRSLSARKLRAFLTLAGIILGVAGLFAINATNQNAYLSITRLFEGTAGRVDLEVRSAANTGGMPESTLRLVADTTGVSQAVPVLKLQAALRGESPGELDLNFFGTGTGGLLLLGIDPAADSSVRDYTLTEGSFLTEGDSETPQVVLVQEFALENKISVGDQISIIIASGPVDLQVVGFMSKEGAGLTNLGNFGVLSLTVAQELAGRQGEIDQVDVVVDTAGSGDPTLLSRVRTELMDNLGDTYSVSFAANQGDRMTQMLSGYQIGLNFLAGIALFVGAFLIYNAFSMTLAERTRELGLLRAIGMSRRQIVSQVVSEGLFMGIAGALAGAAAGLLLSRGLVAVMSRFLGVSLDPGMIIWPTLLLSMAIGVVVTLLAAMLPAYQAGRVSPLEALRLRGKTEGGWLLSWGWAVGVLLLIVSAGILVWNPFPYDVQFRLGSFTVFALFFGAMLIVPVTLRLWQGLWRVPFKLIYGGVGEIGTRNLERAHKRTMLTCAALLVGVSMIVVIQGMTGSFTADLYAWIDAYAGGDIFVAAAVPLSRSLQEDFEALPGVDVAAPLRYIDVTWIKAEAEEELSFMAVDPDSYRRVTRFLFEGDNVSADDAMAELSKGGVIFVSSVISEKYGVVPGDALRLRTRAGEKDFRVAAVVIDFYNQGLAITGSWRDLQSLFAVNEATTFLIAIAPNSDVDAVINEISNAYGDDYQLVVESNVALKQRAQELMGQAFSMFDVLGVIAVLVAALGVLNTLSMSVVERTREIGMLRSIGMTRSQIVKMILAEAGLIGIIGGLLGLGFGILLTRIFLAAMGAMSGYALDFVLPVRAIWLSLTVALITSQFAALLPAMKAAFSPILEAIQYE